MPPHGPAPAGFTAVAVAVRAWVGDDARPGTGRLLPQGPAAAPDEKETPGIERKPLHFVADSES